MSAEQATVAPIEGAQRARAFAARAHGVLVDGAFDPLDGAPRLPVFDPASGKGSVCYIVTQPPDAPAAFLLIDAPGVYRKVALMSFVDQIMPEGFDGTYQTAVGFFSATEADWEQKAVARAREVKAIGAALANGKEEKHCV